MAERPDLSDDRPLYLSEVGGAPFFAVFQPPVEPATATAVLFCPPFGYDHLCAYRALRAWGREVAGAGHAGLRLDLPGTGDSALGARDPGLVDAWIAAVAASARWLRATAGAQRVVAVGVGLGGLLALGAAGRGAPIDDFVLWGVPGRGRGLVRELRAFSRLGGSGAADFAYDPSIMPPLPDGGLEAGGFLLTAETLAALAALDATAAPLPAAADRRVLLLGRDDISPDARLVSALEGAGADVTVGSGRGWAAMLDSPHLSVLPREAFALTAAWLAEDDGRAACPTATPTRAAADVHATDTVTFGDGATAITERPLRLDGPGGRLFGVLTEPADGVARRPNLCGVLLNVGAERRIGPNRLWVEVARRWAARGVPVLRLDALGMGDADGPDQLSDRPAAALYERAFMAQLDAALDGLAAAGLPSRFVVAGVCSGAFWAFQLAVADARVAAALPINARLLLPDIALIREALALETPFRPRPEDDAPAAPPPAPVRRLPQEAARARLAAWAHSGAAQPVRRVLRRPRAKLVIRKVWGLHTRGDDLDQTFDLLRDRGQTVTLRLTPGEPLYPEMLREGRMDRAARWPNVSVDLIAGPPNIHTLQPVRLQPYIHALLDASLDAELARAPHAAASPPSARGDALPA